jgi:methyl-accepting chemotaxis protein
LNDEIRYLEAGKSYPQVWYRQEKDKFSNSIIEDLEKLQDHIQQNTNDKIGRLYEAGREARRMAMIMTGVFLLLGISISFFINRSITQPISVLIDKTREISKWVFQGDLNLSSPPEIRERLKEFIDLANSMLRNPIDAGPVDKSMTVSAPASTAARTFASSSSCPWLRHPHTTTRFFGSPSFRPTAWRMASIDSFFASLTNRTC